MSKISALRTCGEKRLDILGHGGGVIWLTGLSGAGKTTIASAAEKVLLSHGILCALVDGDLLRRGLCRDLGFSLADRRECIRRAAELSFALAATGALVLVALISPIRSSRIEAAQTAREREVPFSEVFVNAPLHVCEARDVKGLYLKARAGEVKNFTGMDSPYEDPEMPELELRTDVESVDICVEKLVTLAFKMTA